MRRALVAACCLLVLSNHEAAVRAETAPAEPRRYAGILSFYVENDLFLNSDDNYTSGVGTSWTSDEASTYGPKNFVNRLVRVASFLPPIRSPRRENFVSLALGQEMYTPTDIES